MGPTILTLPSVLRRVFEEAGRNLEDYIQLVSLDPQWRCFFAGDDKNDSSVLDLVSNSESMKENIDAFTLEMMQRFI